MYNQQNLPLRVGKIPMSLCTLSPLSVAVKEVLEEEVIDWGLGLLGVPELWKFTRGEGVKVAVLDTGVAANHPDLEGAIAATVDFTNSDAGPVDRDGHGTHCIGIIAARQNGKGVVGIAPEVSIYSGKVVQGHRYETLEPLIAGIYWAIEQQVHLISISLSSDKSNKQLEQAIKTAQEAGVLVVAAVGNNGDKAYAVGYPAQYESVLAVGAVDQSLKWLSYSSTGKRVDVVAPGHQITSTYLEEKYAEMNGTSTAAPFVVGLAALILSKAMQEGDHAVLGNPTVLKRTLLTATTKLGKLAKDEQYGFGIIDPQKVGQLF